jgi:hypothetical protein
MVAIKAAPKVTTNGNGPPKPFYRKPGCIAALTVTGLSLASIPTCAAYYKRHIATHGPTIQARSVVTESRFPSESEAYFPPCEMEFKIIEGPYRGQVLTGGLQPPRDNSCESYIGKTIRLDIERVDYDGPFRIVDFGEIK